MKRFLYPGRDLNPHGRDGHRILSPACLPIPPPGQKPTWKCWRDKKKPLERRGKKSERRDSNPRPSPWQGDALPAELLSQCGCKGNINCNKQ